MFNFLTSRLHAATTQGKDRGAAVVAAIGVMIICLALGALVISQAIAAQEDSGRNRARTVEIHNAEGGVDTLYAKLQQGEFVCHWKTTSGDELGPDLVGANAELRYWHESGAEMECTGEKLSVDAGNMPARAKILVTSEAGRSTGSGIQPQRSFESEVILGKENNPQDGAAIFSETVPTFSNDTTLEGYDGNVWISHGDFKCTESVRFEGNVYVADGGALMSNRCLVERDLEVTKDIVLDSAEGPKILGSVSSKNGNLRLESPQSRVAEDANLGGKFTDRTGSVDGQIRENVNFSEYHTPVDLPDVTFNEADWEGFNTMSPSQFAEESLSNLSSHQWGGGACDQEWATGTIHGPSTPTLLNLNGERACEVHLRDVDLELNNDLAIFADRFFADGQVEVKSADGEEHKLWLIVPSDKKGTPGHRTGTIKFTGNTVFNENAPVFLYGQGNVDLSNTSHFYGQVYGYEVSAHNSPKITYREMGIPGVDLMPGYVDLNGEWEVDVVYKRETGDRVN